MENSAKYPATAIELSRKLISIDSTNPGKYEKDIAQYICDWLSYYEIEYERDKVTDERYNIIAYAGKREATPSLVYICHMDTVVIGSGWIKDPFAALIQEDKIYGRGACDMKSGLACAMLSLLSLKNRNAVPDNINKRAFKLICTVDEEDFMRGVESIIEKNYVTKEDFILDTEPTDGQIQVAHKGRIWIEIEVKGVTAHASRPEKGIDAIAGLACLITELRKEINSLPEHEELGKSTITFGQIKGGYRPYVVPDLSKVWVDIRSVPPLTSFMLKKILDENINKVKKEFAGIEISYEFTGDRPYIERNEKSVLLKELKEICEEESKVTQEVSFFTGYTDTAVIAGKLGNINCMSYGPGSLDMAHKPDEYVYVKDIIRCEKVLTALANKLC